MITLEKDAFSLLSGGPRGAALDAAASRLRELLSAPALAASDGSARQDAAVAAAAAAVSIFDQLSTVLGYDDSPQFREEARRFLVENRTALLRATDLEYSVRHALRFESVDTSESAFTISNPELSAKARAYHYACYGAQFVYALDVNGTVSSLDGAFYPGARQGLADAMSLSEVYLISGDKLDKLLSGLLHPEGIITESSSPSSSLHVLGEGAEEFKQMVLVSETGARMLMFSMEEDGLIQISLDPGLSEEQLMFISVDILADMIAEFRMTWSQERLDGLGLKWVLDDGENVALPPGTIQGRDIDGKVSALSVALLGDLTVESRQLLKNLKSIELSEPERYEELSLLLAERHSFLATFKERLRQSEVVEALGAELDRKFQLGGTGTIDYIAADKGDIAYHNFVRPYFLRSAGESLPRPLVVAAFGDHMEGRTGNDHQFRHLAAIHRAHIEARARESGKAPDGRFEGLPFVHGLACMGFEVSGVQNEHPLDLVGEWMVYSPIPAFEGGTALALSWITAAHRLSNFIHDSGISCGSPAA